MTVLAQTLVDDTRVISGLRNNPLFSDDQIVSLLNDAYGAARDKFVVALEHWFRASVNFTLPSGSLPPNTLGSNTFDLTTVADFQMDQGVNWLPGGQSPPIPVPRLGSFAERGTVGGGVGWLAGQYREYFTNGDSLFIDPFTNSAGNYQLIYTPLGIGLGIPANVSIPCDGVNTGFSSSAFLNGPPGTPFLPTDVGLSVTIAGAVNVGNNGTFPINAFDSPTRVTLTGSFTAETLPTSATVTILNRQPAGTRPDLPAVLTQLALFLKTHAAIAIKVSRKQPTGQLQATLQAEAIRVLALAKKRTEGPKQAPITNRRRRWGVSYLG